MTLYILTRHSKPPDWVLALLSCLPILRASILPPLSHVLLSISPPLYLEPRQRGSRVTAGRGAPSRWIVTFFRLERPGESWRRVEREREREGGEAGSISERGELELKLSPAVDTVSGEVLFFSERRQMFGYQVRNRSLFFPFSFLFFDGRTRVFREVLRNFSYFVALFFFERMNGVTELIFAYFDIFFLSFFF